MAVGKVSRQGGGPCLMDQRRTNLAGGREQRHRAWRNLSLRPQDSQARAAVQSPGETSSRSLGRDEDGPLQVGRRAGDPCLSHAAQRHPWQEPAHHHLSPRRALGPRCLGLQPLCPVLCQPGLRRAEHELSRFRRLWQEIYRRRQPGMGPQDAGRRHLGSKVPDR